MKRTETMNRLFPFTFVTRPVIPRNGPSAIRTTDLSHGYVEENSAYSS